MPISRRYSAVSVASVTCPWGEGRDQYGGDALIPRADDSGEHIEGLCLPADHYPGMALGDSVEVQVFKTCRYSSDNFSEQGRARMGGSRSAWRRCRRQRARQDVREWPLG
jgi:hypothetical protein